MTPTVSIALLTLDGMATLPAVLDAIAAQEVEADVELVAVDSGSTDGTVALLQDRADLLLRVEPGDFDHGLTRNLAVGRSRGELVVLLVQDAEPSSSRWLAELTVPFDDDRRLAGSFARQLPRPDASRLTRWSLERWVAAQETGHSSEVAGREAWDVMAPMDRFLACVFDNVCSCVRRAVWQQHPFRSTPIAEDLEWARDVLLAGHRLAYMPGAAVVHSHERSVRYELGRTYLVHRRLHELFGVRTIPTAAKLVHAIWVTLPEHLRCLLHEPGPRPGPREISRALGLAVAWPLGQYLGGLAAVRRRDLLHPRGV